MYNCSSFCHETNQEKKYAEMQKFSEIKRLASGKVSSVRQSKPSQLRLFITEERERTAGSLTAPYGAGVQ